MNNIYIKVIISSNVLDPDDDTVVYYKVVDRKLTLIPKRCHQGMYAFPEWENLDDLIEAVTFDPTGQHPETYYSLRLTVDVGVQGQLSIGEFNFQGGTADDFYRRVIQLVSHAQMAETPQSMLYKHWSF